MHHVIFIVYPGFELLDARALTGDIKLRGQPSAPRQDSVGSARFGRT